MSGVPGDPSPSPAPLAGSEPHQPSKCDGDGGGPVGLRALCAACARLYPAQPNPLQVTARVKYWLGGPDPLDYISMYWNAGRPELSVPPHWHYISLGLSDLHGDGRVHAPPDRVLLANDARAPPSGFGFEMSFRLAAPAASPAAAASASAPAAPPPLWPAALLQSLARYIFTTGVRLCVGDHISWHAPLDAADAGSRVRHMLVAEDAQLRTVRTPLGDVQFVQMVGATGGEVRAARRGTGADVLRAMAADAACGGAWLATDAARRATCAAVRAASAARAAPAASARPADLAGVSTLLHWAEWTPREDEGGAEEEGEEEEGGALPETVQEEIKCLLQKGLQEMRDGGGGGGGRGDEDALVQMSTDSVKSEPRAATQLSTDSLKQIFTGGGGGSKQMSMSGESFAMQSVERALAAAAGAPAAGGARALPAVHVVFNAEGGSLLPLALQGRILHSRHFTWRCASGARAVTFVSAGVSGALVSPQQPYVATAHGWLQVLIPAWLAREMCARTAWLERAADSDSEGEGAAAGDGGAGAGAGRLPLALCWPRVGLKVTVLHPDTPLY